MPDVRISALGVFSAIISSLIFRHPHSCDYSVCVLMCVYNRLAQSIFCVREMIMLVTVSTLGSAGALNVLLTLKA